MPTASNHSRSFRATKLLAMAGALASGGAAFADVVYEANFESGVVGTEWSDTAVGSEGGPFGTYLGNFGAGTVTLTLGGDDGSGGGNPGGPGNVSNNGGVRPQPGHRGGGNPGGGARGTGGGLKPLADAILDLGAGSGGGNGGGGNPGGGLGAGFYNITFDLYLFDSWDGRDPIHGVDRFVVIANGTKVFDEALETFEPHENWYGGWETAGSAAYSDSYRDLIYRAVSLNFTVAEEGAVTIDFISKQNQDILDESWGLDNVRVTRSTVRAASVPVPAGPTTLVLVGGLLCGARRRR